MAVFTWAADLLRAMLEKNGQTVTVRWFDREMETPTTQPWRQQNLTPRTATTRAIFRSVNRKYIDGDTIRIGDLEMVSIEDVTIPVDAEIDRGGQVWKVLNVEEMNPNGEVIGFRAHLRRGTTP